MNKSTRTRHLAHSPVGRDVDRRGFQKLTGAGLVAAMPVSTAAVGGVAMTHIAIQEKLDGKPVDWLEHVTPEQYERRSGGS